MAAAYKLTSVRISPFCELARWVLEYHRVPYAEKCHVPIWNVPFTWFAGHTPNVPVVEAPDAILQIRPFLDYIEEHTPESDRLYPTDPAQRAEMAALLKTFIEVVAIDVRLYAYANMLPDAAVTGALMTCRAPAWEAGFVKTFYPLQLSAMRKVLGITPASQEKARLDILSAFQTVSDRLKPGQRFLIGDRLTTADLTFAAVTGPILLPPEYDAPMPKLSDLPVEMKNTVLAVQSTLAGKQALAIYRDFRKH